MSLLGDLNTIREDTLAKHFGAAKAELQAMISAEPLRTEFTLISGCVSEEVTQEVIRRLNEGGLKAKMVKTGVITTGYSIKVTVDLPENLNPFVPVEINTVETEKGVLLE